MKHYFQLLEVLALREIKSRYKASILGFLWIIIYPLATAVILSLIFSVFIRISSENIPYFLFLLSGLLYWNFFQQGFILAKGALLWNRDLVVKTAFPKSTLPLAYVFSRIPDFFINLGILVIFYLYYGYALHLGLLLAVLPVLAVMFFLAGMSLIFSALNAIFRDFGRIVDLFMMLLFYATPIVYPDSLVPANFKFFILLNPIAGAVVFTRELIFRDVIRMELLLTSLLISIPIFILGMIFFIKIEKKLVDLI